MWSGVILSSASHGRKKFREDHVPGVSGCATVRHSGLSLSIPLLLCKLFLAFHLSTTGCADRGPFDLGKIVETEMLFHAGFLPFSLYLSRHTLLTRTFLRASCASLLVQQKPLHGVLYHDFSESGARLISCLRQIRCCCSCLPGEGALLGRLCCFRVVNKSR